MPKAVITSKAAITPYVVPVAPSMAESSRQQPVKSTKSSKSVRFASTKECRTQLDSHYPTPHVARNVPQNGSTSRRFTIDEVELYFSEDRPNFPMSSQDYAVHKTAKRVTFVLCGFIDIRRVKLGITSWLKCWAELYVGILVVREFKDTIQRKRTLIPVAGGRLKFLDFSDNVMQIDYIYQGKNQASVLRFQTQLDMFLWWWSIEVAARVPMEAQMLHKCMSRSFLSPDQIQLGTYQVNNVLFPKVLQPEEIIFSKSMQNPQGVIHLFFIRHGETENMNFRVCDKDKRLTKRGEEQAKITAMSVTKMLHLRGKENPDVTLIYGGLRRTRDTAAIFAKVIPWISHKYECCFLEDGAPKNVDVANRFNYRESMHEMAFQNICRWGDDVALTCGPKGYPEKFMLIIAHTSFIQYCMAQCYSVPREIIHLGAPICHCSITRIDLRPNDELLGKFSNRVTHLPLTHQTSE
ncbi:hypothetical protein CCR75_000669 [Bremia lactucae]|uniref:Serine/threonine-protein phosphatase PGAM5, mitochondrial n=1 Tax=Bremia lactucae TaxID=4779 RepID=A0A976IBP5_BRELC|nr:hypothetical protein CCR75_000669 [Bremia lactucae]